MQINALRIRRLLVRTANRAMAFGLFAALLTAAPASQAQQIVQPLAGDVILSLPGVAGPRGIAMHPETGELFVSTFDLRRPPEQSNSLMRFSPAGELVARIEFGERQLFGLAFNPRDRHLYMALAGLPQILRVPADFDSSSQPEVIAVLPSLGADASGAPTTAQPNGLLFRESDGALLASDHSQGAIALIADPSLAANPCPNGSECVRMLLQDSRLLPAADSFPAVGANGIALSLDERRLFIGNQTTGGVFAANLAARGGPSLRMLLSLPGPDGFARGPGDTILAASLRLNAVVIIDGTSGSILAQLGSLVGVDGQGMLLGLRAPANLIRTGDSLLVTSFGSGPQPMLPAGIPAPVPPPTRFGTVSQISIPFAILQRETAARR